MLLSFEISWSGFDPANLSDLVQLFVAEVKPVSHLKLPESGGILKLL